MLDDTGNYSVDERRKHYKERNGTYWESLPLKERLQLAQQADTEAMCEAIEEIRCMVLELYQEMKRNRSKK